LLHEESYCYLLDARRVVKPGGRIVFSFLEYEDNWPVFENAYTALLNGEITVHLNMFVHRSMIEAWARKLNLRILEFHGAAEPIARLSRPVVYDDGRRVEGAASLGQSICVLANDKPATREPDRTPSYGGYDVKYRVD
jgi:SAM-dependent methyltransferase